MINIYPKQSQSNMYFNDVETGSPSAVDGHHGMPHFVDYMTAIGIGKVSGHTPFRGYGYRGNITNTATGDDIWQGTATTIPFADQSVGEQMSIKSDNANDTAAGSGAQQIEVSYLDAAGAQQTTLVEMNGTTAVDLSVSDVRFPQFMHASRMNFGSSSAGNIILFRKTDVSRVYLNIAAGTNASLSSARMVPAGVNFYMNHIHASAAGKETVSMRLRATCDQDGNLTPGIFIFDEIFTLENSAIATPLPIPRVFPPLCIIKGTAFSTATASRGSMSYCGWIE